MNLNKKISDEEAMGLALEQARQGLGRVSPNPPVGVVILDKNGFLLSQGFHKAYRCDHAEIMALKKIQDQNLLNEARMYTTLEPCNFQGLTPSCAHKLSKIPFAKIMIGLKDPNPKVNGQGWKLLQDNFIKVELYEGPLKTDLYELIEIFAHNMKYHQPFVSLKIASSLDNRIAGWNQQWITGEESRKQVQLLRTYYDSVCIGINTLLQDNPRLNSRHPTFMDKQNKVIILDPDGKSFNFLETSKLIQVRDPSNIIIITAKPKETDHQYIILKKRPNKKGQFELNSILEDLFSLGIRSILVEGGAEVFNSFFQKSQRIYLFLSPSFIGKHSSTSWSQDLNIDQLTWLKDMKWSSFGQDKLVTGRLNHS